MQIILDLLFSSGKKGFEIVFYILLPLMVVMMAMIRFLERQGIIRLLVLIFAPLVMVFGIPGLGVLAIIQILFVSFIAPASTLKLIDEDHSISQRKIAAAYAAILCMSQANATFPLAAFGLNLPVVMLTSLIGGLIAALITFKYIARDLVDNAITVNDKILNIPETGRKSIMQTIFAGAEEGLQMALKALPLFIIALFIVSLLKEFGAILLLQQICAPLFATLGISTHAILVIITKYLAGGTAMMGVSIQMLQDGTMTAVDLNRIAGFTINPFDPIAISLLLSVGKRIAEVTAYAIKGAIIGICIRGVLHLLIF